MGGAAVYLRAARAVHGSAAATRPSSIPWLFLLLPELISVLQVVCTHAACITQFAKVLFFTIAWCLQVCNDHPRTARAGPPERAESLQHNLRRRHAPDSRMHPSAACRPLSGAGLATRSIAPAKRGSARPQLCWPSHMWEPSTKLRASRA